MTAVLQEGSTPKVARSVWAAYRTLLVHVEPESSASPRLAAATTLARRFDAMLVGVGAETIEPIAFAVPFEGSDGGWFAELQRQIDDDLLRAESVFRTSATGLQSQWDAVEAIPVAAVIRQACRADLIIAGGSPLAVANPNRHCDPAELILLSGRPVLVVPPNGGELTAEAVVVAWKDTREARRALADAMPFLQNALDVVVVQVCGEDERHEAQTQCAAVVEGLLRHDVKVRSKVVIAGPDHAAEVLNREAQAVGADLIVAGGYGHSRMGEWVFGGATRDLLQAPERFLLMSH